MKPSPDESKEERVGFQETKEEPILNIMYKGMPYIVNIRFGMTIEALKTAVLNMLVNKAIITDTNFNVKFIYKGKVITDNTVVLDSLNQPDGMVGQTMQVMLSAPTTTGGKKRKTKKRRKKQSKRKRNTRNTRNYNK